MERAPKRARAKKEREGSVPCSVLTEKPGAPPPPSTVHAAEDSVHGAPSTVPADPSGALAQESSVHAESSSVQRAPWPKAGAP
jgi:hypothetical protein